MKLFNIINGISYDLVQGNNDLNIEYLSIDSRNIRKDTLFICIQGLHVDGHNYIEGAVSDGACAIVIDKDIANLPKNITVIKVNKSREALSYIASNFFNNPNKKLNLVGVTGTNGKTSTTYFMEAILRENDFKTGVIGTVETRINDEVVTIDFATSTTPDSIELQQILAHMEQKDVSHVVMEVSSHALELHKVDGFTFEVSIFTNLTQDHLDLHGTMENYKRAKSKLFAMSRNSVINIDDSVSDFMIQQSAGKVLTYSIEKDSDLKAINIVYSNVGVTFDIYYDNVLHKFEIPIPGKFSVYNALGVIGAAIALGISIDIIKNALSKLKGVPGRIQSIKNTKGLSVIVDYAHTPDGLENIIGAVRDFTKGKVITVFGCGGDRDKTKRPIMGEIAARMSNFCVITSDNPRTENPNIILDEIEVGVKTTSTDYTKIVDRKEAIKYAIDIATKNDSVIIAGKGHENYQIFANETIYFDDSQVAMEVLNMEE